MVESNIGRASGANEAQVNEAEAESPVNSFVADHLKSKRSKVFKKYGESYAGLVSRLITLQDTPLSRRGPDDKDRLLQESRELGLPDPVISTAQEVSREMYPDWLEHKHSLQRQQESPFASLRGAEDPNVYMSDASHRRGLGDI